MREGAVQGARRAVTLAANPRSLNSGSEEAGGNRL